MVTEFFGINPAQIAHFSSFQAKKKKNATNYLVTIPVRPKKSYHDNSLTFVAFNYNYSSNPITMDKHLHINLFLIKNYFSLK